MRRFALIVLLAASTAAGPGRAAAPESSDADLATLRPAFGNTIRSTYVDGVDGRYTLLWVDPDGRFQARRSNGQRTAGRWRLRNGRFCLWQTKPFPFPLTYCPKVPSGGIGDRWPSRGVKNEPMISELVAGQAER